MKLRLLAVACLALAVTAQAAARGAARSTLRLPPPDDRGAFTLAAELPAGATLTQTTRVKGHAAAVLRVGRTAIRVDAPGRLEFGTVGTTQKWQQTPQQAAVHLRRRERGLTAQKIGTDRYVLRDRGGVRYALVAAEAPEMQTYRFQLQQGGATGRALLTSIASGGRIYLGSVDPRTIVPDPGALALMEKARSAMAAAPFVTITETLVLHGDTWQGDRWEILVADDYEAHFYRGEYDRWRKGTTSFRYESGCWNLSPTFSDASPVPTVEPGWGARLSAPRQVGSTLEVTETSYPRNTSAPVPFVWTFDGATSLPLRQTWESATFGTSVTALDWITPVRERPQPTKLCARG